MREPEGRVWLHADRVLRCLVAAVWVVTVACGGEKSSSRQDPAASSPAEPPPPPSNVIRLNQGQTYGAMTLATSDVVLDGQGAWIIGAAFGDPRNFTGTGIRVAGVANVIIRNVNVRGFETGLRVADSSNVLVEGCNFSDNFHDPSFGWGENGRRGGIVMERVTNSVLRNNRANRVWDACVLVDSDDNTIENNDFSVTSDTCLKMWTSCRNTVRDNNLSYGIRISPGEVHARDSCCVLIESGSNGNTFLNNNATHGGDGFFLRGMNRWVSTGNYFEGNDASYANNNCFESWCPGNTYVGNTANWGSYGFWMGASNKTVLIGNEAAYNGQPSGNDNAPEPGFGFGGIVIVNDPSAHVFVSQNNCHHNNGGGVVLRGDMATAGGKYKARHWIIQQNTLEANRWGIYMQYADWVSVAANTYLNNTMGTVANVGGVTNLTMYPDNLSVTQSPNVVLEGPSIVSAGAAFSMSTEKTVDPAGLPLTFRWDLGDGTISTAADLTHAYAAAGFYRLGLTVNNGSLSQLAYRDMYVLENVPEVGTDGAASLWALADEGFGSVPTFSNDTTVALHGGSSIKAVIKPYSGSRVHLQYPSTQFAGISLAGKTHVVFWIKHQNQNVWSWQDTNPTVRLYQTGGQSRMFTPTSDLLHNPPYVEACEGWLYVAIPLAGGSGWTVSGSALSTVNWIRIGVDSWEYEPITVWVDGLGFR